MFVATWDLIKNIEYSMIELNEMESNKPQNLICKGMKEKHNYIMTKTNSYDLFYLLPFKFIKAEDDFKNIGIGRNERKLSKDFSLYLGMGNQNTIHMTYTLLDLYYCHMLTLEKDREITPNMINLEHLEPKYDGKTIFH
jgi:hypothetical protein